MIWQHHMTQYLQVFSPFSFSSRVIWNLYFYLITIYLLVQNWGSISVACLDFSLYEYTWEIKGKPDEVDSKNALKPVMANKKGVWVI